MIFKSAVKGNTNSTAWRLQRPARMSLFFDLFPTVAGRAVAQIREIKPVNGIFEEKFHKEALDVVRQAAWKDG